VIELLVAIAIIAVLMAIVFVALAPAREKGRQAVCISHFQQIAKSVAMYRQDYHGQEPDGPRTYYELGLPETVFPLMKKYLPSPEIWRCPNEMPSLLRKGMLTSYGWQVWDDRRKRKAWPRVARFSELVGMRGEDFPLMYDVNHTSPIHLPEDHLVIVLRLGGHVTSRRVPPLTPSWEF
jgi:hypothetical protein